MKTNFKILLTPGPFLVALHFMSIFLFLGQEIVILYILGIPPTFKGYMAFLLEVGTFYANLLWVVPHVFDQKKRMRFVVSLGLVVLTHALLRGMLAYNPAANMSFLQFFFSLKQLMLTAWRLTLVLDLSFLLGFYKATEKATKEKARVEAIMRQTQLSPHNQLSGLSFIQNNVQKQLPHLAEVVRLMAEILRYSLIDVSTTPQVPLTAELQQVQNRIQYHKYLMGRPVFVQYRQNITDDEIPVQLPPSLLITLVDNVLKYGKLFAADSPAQIDVSTDSGILKFNTWNLKADRIKPGTGIGLYNVKQILEYYYPGRYKLVTNDLPGTYSLTLSIKI